MDSDSDDPASQSDDEFHDDDGDDDPDFGSSTKPRGKGPPKLKKCKAWISEAETIADTLSNSWHVPFCPTRWLQLVG